MGGEENDIIMLAKFVSGYAPAGVSGTSGLRALRYLRFTLLR